METASHEEKLSSNLIPLALKHLDRLYLRVPPAKLFEQLFGYDGDSRFVAFYLAATKLCYDDGRTCGTGSYWPYGTWLQHHSVRPVLAEYNLGDDDQYYEHWLVLDRVHRRLYAGPWREAARIVQRQGGRQDETAPLQLSFDDLQELAEQIAEAMPPAPSMAKIQRRHKEQQAKIMDLVAWLDRQAA